MKEKLITKSFERLLDKGEHRGFITYEELGKSKVKKKKIIMKMDYQLLLNMVNMVHILLRTEKIIVFLRNIILKI